MKKIFLVAFFLLLPTQPKKPKAKLALPAGMRLTRRKTKGKLVRPLSEEQRQEVRRQQREALRQEKKKEKLENVKDEKKEEVKVEKMDVKVAEKEKAKKAKKVK